LPKAEGDLEVAMDETNDAQRQAGDVRACFDDLSDEDLMFVKRFVLASGSQKELARAYGISYPTVRLRLDRLIQKIQVLDAHRPASPFERLLRALHADGRIDLEALKSLLAAHEQALGESS
jgi:hypothetical protein